MDYFSYTDGILCCESCAVPALAQQFGTPLYVYSSRTLLEHYQRFESAFSALKATICFSVKSCQNLSILRLLKGCGAAFDVVSGGELRRVLEAGADPQRVVFAGVGKTDEELRFALDSGIGWFNAESEAELENLAGIAAKMGKVARAALRINPDVDPKTHLYTSTGKRETKFGVDLSRAYDVFKDFTGRDGIELSGVHLHLGSPVNTIDPYVSALIKTVSFIEQLRRSGFKVQALNIGGGFGAHYSGSEAPAASAYAKQIVPLLRDKELAVFLEPGRSIVANAGVLIAKVLYTKASGDKQFVIIDAAMTDLIRPALYGSFHFVWPVSPRHALVPASRSLELSMAGTGLVDIVGPVCESGDFLAKDRRIPPVTRGDLICIFSSGAYGFVMSSQYNSRPRAAEILIDGDKATLIRRRENYDDLVRAERF